jgi:hypothetical protein
LPDPISPDEPELRLLAQLAGLKPSAIAAALNNPEHFNKHVNAEEMARFAGAESRVIALISRISTHLTPYIEAHTARIQKGKNANVR